MRLAQITDIHHNDFMSQSEGINSINRLNVILDNIKVLGINKVILTGDYGDPTYFNKIIDLIKNNDMNYEYILGNHDDIKDYSGRNDLNKNNDDNGLYYSIQENNNLFLYLDSRNSMIDERQKEFIINKIEEIDNSKIIIFIHHPILDCGCTMMDKKYPLKNREEIIVELMKTGKPIYIFTGHYHNNYFSQINNIKQYVTMSALLQLKPYSRDIDIENTIYGYRIIEISETVNTETIAFKDE